MDNFSMLREGDPIPKALSASRLNRLIETARETDGVYRELGDAASQLESDRPYTAVWVASQVGYDIGAVISLGSAAVLDPTNDLVYAARRPVFNGGSPNALLPVAIVLDPSLVSGELVRAAVSGLALTKITGTGNWASVIDGDKAKLQAGAQGPIRIVWQETGSGVRWAVVRLGDQRSLLSVRESDGDPIYTAVTDLRFNAAHFTLTVGDSSSVLVSARSTIWVEIGGEDNTVTFGGTAVDADTGLDLTTVSGGGYDGWPLLKLRPADGDQAGVVDLVDGQIMGLGRKQFSAITVTQDEENTGDPSGTGYVSLIGAAPWIRFNDQLSVGVGGTEDSPLSYGFAVNNGAGGLATAPLRFGNYTTSGTYLNSNILAVGNADHEVPGTPESAAFAIHTSYGFQVGATLNYDGSASGPRFAGGLYVGGGFSSYLTSSSNIDGGTW